MNNYFIQISSYPASPHTFYTYHQQKTHEEEPNQPTEQLHTHPLLLLYHTTIGFTRLVIVSLLWYSYATKDKNGLHHWTKDMRF